MNGPLKFLTARKILSLLDLLAKFKRVLACSCSPNFCLARKHAKQFFYFCSCSQKNRSARHARECSQRPFVNPSIFSYFPSQATEVSETKIFKRAPTSFLYGSPPGEADHHLFDLIFLKVNDYYLLRVLALLHLVHTSMDDRFRGEK